MLLLLHTCAAFMVVNIVIFLIMLWLNPIEDDNFIMTITLVMIEVLIMRIIVAVVVVMLKTVLTVI